MTTNRLAKPAEPRRSGEEVRLEAVARGNAYLAEIGRDRELHWYIHQDQLLLGFKGQPGARA